MYSAKARSCALSHMRVCQIGWSGLPWARNPKTPHFLAGPGPARPSATPHFYRRTRAGPAPQIPHFYRRALRPHGPPKSLTFIDGAQPPNPSLLLARPLTSISQARRRNPSVTPASVTPRSNGTAPPYFPRFDVLPVWQTFMCSLASIVCCMPAVQAVEG